MADVLVSGRACGAGAAPLQRHDRHRLAHAQALNTGADRGDAAGHLVADRLRRLDSMVHGTVQDVQVGTADAGVGHLDLHLSRAWNHRRPILDHDGGVTGVER